MLRCWRQCSSAVFQHVGDAVTQVKLKEAVDHVLAVSYFSGAVCVFRLLNDMHAKSMQVISAFCRH